MPSSFLLSCVVYCELLQVAVTLSKAFLLVPRMFPQLCTVPPLMTRFLPSVLLPVNSLTPFPLSANARQQDIMRCTKLSCPCKQAVQL